METFKKIDKEVELERGDKRRKEKEKEGKEREREREDRVHRIVKARTSFGVIGKSLCGNTRR